MSLRISLILIIILAYISIGVTCYYTQETQSTYNLEDPPFFYNIDTDKLSKIIVESGEKKQSWYHNEKFDKSSKISEYEKSALPLVLEPEMPQHGPDMQTEKQTGDLIILDL